MKMMITGYSAFEYIACVSLKTISMHVIDIIHKIKLIYFIVGMFELILTFLYDSRISLKCV
jgi:hypothetical protein